MEKTLKKDRRIASYFNWDEIHKNAMLPFPYVVSFTNRNDNDYLWKNYADHGHGVALELDDSKTIYLKDTPVLLTKSCLYAGQMSDLEIYKEIKNEYADGGLGILRMDKSGLALNVLAKSPQQFVRWIACYLLIAVAPRIKKCDKQHKFYKEEERRVIIPSFSESMLLSVQQAEMLFSNMQIPIDFVPLKSMTTGELQRKRDNNEIIYYKEMFLPSRVLTKVYIKDDSILSNVKTILKNKNYGNIDVEVIK